MAVTRDQDFRVNIVVDTKGAKPLKDALPTSAALTASLAALERQIEILNQTLSAHRGVLTSVQKTHVAMNQNATASINAIGQQQAALDRLNDTMLQTVSSSQSLNQLVAVIATLNPQILGLLQEVSGFAFSTRDLLKGLNGADDGVKGFSETVVESESSLVKLGRTFENFAVPMTKFSSKLVELRNNYATWLSSVKNTSYTGKAITGGLDFASDALDKFSAKLHTMPEQAMRAATTVEKFMDDFPRMGAAIRAVDNAFSKLLTGITKLGNGFQAIFGKFTTFINNLPPISKIAGELLNNIGAMTGALFGAGIALVHTDSTLAKLAGGSMIAFSIAVGGISVAIRGLISAIGGLIESFGEKLFTLFDGGIKAAEADQLALANFERTILRLSGSMEKGQANIASWNETLSKITDTARFAGSEAQGLAESVARTGQEFNLTQKQQEGLAVAIASFSKNAQEAMQYSDAIRLAFLGTGKQAEELGLHINDLAVNNSDYAISISKVATNMTRQELVTARLKLIMDQAGTAAAVLASQNESLAETQHKIAVAQAELDAQFSAASLPLYQKLAQIQLQFLLVLERIPQGLKNAINETTSWTGAILIAIGAGLKWIFLIGGAVTAVNFLSNAIRANAIAQVFLTSVFSVTNAAVGVQAVGVKALSDVFVNLALLLRGTVTSALVGLGRTIMTTTVTVLRFTATLLLNPLFLAGAALAASVYFIVGAVQDLRQELSFLTLTSTTSQKATDGATKSLSIYEKSLQAVNTVAQAALVIMRNLAKILVSGFIAAIVELGLAYAKLRGYMASSAADQKKWAAEVETLRGDLAQLTAVISKSGIAMADVFTGTAKGAEAAGEKVGGLADSMSKFQRTLALLKSDPIQDAYLKTSVLGDAFARAKAQFQSANTEFNKAFNDLMLQQDQTKDQIDAVAGKRGDAAKAYLEMLKTQKDALKDMRRDENQNNIDALRDKQQLIDASVAEGVERLRVFDEIAKGMKAMGMLSRQQLKDIERARDELLSRNGAAIQKAINETRKAYLDDRAAAAEAGGNEVAKINARYEKQLEGFRQAMAAGRMAPEEYLGAVSEAGKKRIEDLTAFAAKVTGDLTEANKLALQRMQDDLDDALEAGIISWQQYAKGVERAQAQMAHKQVMDQAARAAEPYNNIADELSTQVVAPMLSGFSKIVDAVQALIDFIPSLLDKIANVITSFTALPTNIAAAANRVFTAAMGFANHFVENLANAAGKILTNGARFIEKFPEALQRALMTIGDTFAKVIQRIDWRAVISQLIIGLVEGGPRIAIGIAVALVRATPQIALALVQAFARDLPAAIGQAFRQIAHDFVDLLNGRIKLPKIDPAPLKDVLSKIAGSSSQLFKVEDFKAATRSVDIGARIAMAAQGAAINIGNLFAALWKAFLRMLKDAWQWVWNQILAPIEALVAKAWQWVVDHVLTPLAGVVAKAFQWVIDKILVPLETFVAKAFQWVVDKILTPLDGIVARAFGWVVDKVLTPLATIGQTAFQWVETRIVTPLLSIGETGFKWVETNVVKPLQTFFANLTSWSFPKFSWPALPDLSKLSWPTLPSLRNLSWPDLPKIAAPTWTLSVPKPSWGIDVLKPNWSITIDKPGWWPSSIGGLVPSGFSADNPGGIVHSIGSGITKATGIGRHAEGGIVRPLYAASGTLVQGTDTVPAMLTPGEFVINRHAVGRVGTPLLERINGGNAPGGHTAINVSLTVNTQQPIDGAFIRGKLVPVLMDAIKNASESGRYVLNAKGVRGT